MLRSRNGNRLILSTTHSWASVLLMRVLSRRRLVNYTEAHSLLRQFKDVLQHRVSRTTMPAMPYLRRPTLRPPTHSNCTAKAQPNTSKIKFPGWKVCRSRRPTSSHTGLREALRKIQSGEIGPQTVIEQTKKPYTGSPFALAQMSPEKPARVSNVTDPFTAVRRFFDDLQTHVSASSAPVTFTPEEAAFARQVIEQQGLGKLMRNRSLWATATKMRNFALGDYGAKRNMRICLLGPPLHHMVLVFIPELDSTASRQSGLPVELHACAQRHP